MLFVILFVKYLYCRKYEYSMLQYCFEKWKLIVARERLKNRIKACQKTTVEANQCPMVFILNCSKLTKNIYYPSPLVATTSIFDFYSKFI